MKKFLSIVMVLALVCSMSITVFAEETGSITITNATIGEDYAIYKIFDANIKKNSNGDTEGVGYTISQSNQFFEVLFGVDGTAANTFFEYNATLNGEVRKKKDANDSELVKYLTNLVATGNYSSVASVKAVSEELKFEDLPYGYYLITSSLGTTVTINSNTPDVKVIDKNQEPGIDFDKLVQTGVDKHGNPIWGEANTANIGDKITYKISFVATNYDGDKKIKYYRIYDEKGDAIWAEFDSIEVSVGGVKLDRGYYLSQGGDNTDNWEYLGDWSAIPAGERDRDDAQWYLVHTGYDTFRITIPWLENHTLNDETDANSNVVAYSLSFPEDAASKYDSPVDVEIVYDAAIEAGAAVGNTSHGNRYNKAELTWTSEYETGSAPPDEVVSYVYGIGLLKDDSATGQNLAGAKFRIYKDADCTIPVYVIPTDIKGVYIVDSLNTFGEEISGTKTVTARDLYAAYLAEYLGSNIQDNYVISQVNGKLVILGLGAGTYYLQEVEPPAGYNGLSVPVEIEAGVGSRAFTIFADEAGNVADIQQTDGIHTAKTYDLTYTVVHNSKGVELPSTGGEGTFWLITIGTLLAIGFAVFLITHKKMSVYAD